MPTQKGLEWIFDTVATTYEKLRPGYVDELYQTVFDYIPIDESSNVVEVGSGGGQATAPMLKTGCCLTAVEYGRQFSERLRERDSESIQIFRSSQINLKTSNSRTARSIWCIPPPRFIGYRRRSDRKRYSPC